MEKELDVSVIIPAYNAVGCIETAINSVQQQEGMNWELIIVENGSTDDTYEKCLEQAKQDARIQVLQSEKGVSNARNKGIEAAKGTWICFLDADDYLYPNAFSQLKPLADRKQNDIIVFDHNSDSAGTEGAAVSYDTESSYLELRCMMLKNPTRYMPVWGKLFAREIMAEQEIRFAAELSFAEDADFTFRFMQHAKKGSLFQAQLYHYSKDNASTVRTYKPGMAEKYMLSMQHTANYVQNDCQEIKDAYQQYIAVHLLLILVHDTFCEENPASDKEKKEAMRQLLKNRLFADALKAIPVSACKSARMLPILCFKMKMDFAAVWMVKMRIRQNHGR